MKDFFSLLSFLTPIPVPRKYREGGLSFGSVYLLPIIGLLRGGIAIIPAAVLLSLKIKLVPLIAFSIVALHFIMQGFLHADGFIDFTEALLAGRFGVDAKKVLKDKYRGSYAIASFSVFTLWLYSSLSSFQEPGYALILFPISAEVWSPSSMILTSLLSGEPPEGMGREFKRSSSPSSLAASLLISFPFTLMLSFSLKLSLIITALSLSSLLLSSLLSYYMGKKALGYANGDVLGFSNELCYALLLTVYAAGAYLWI
ncbi:adenosylcobinamide-GDP ribazoletransferase [Fervidicoccus fontis]|uniref:Adenosylcobinamide-GDP ribazoletransferase n=1 Tax=Fervidicoccus fontis (strain DSM 19380 / JCM 18336 / VKM B-2539 / Kam940) TaxID=1163730 RepID=H9ZZ66_FERFK|nr:adenosylcobinamide-GDP ribazoletransferase [Fervidicoccus fontis]AFH42023.1 cobalamin 5'-phosphate synthase [Fervidicoccus fontis Kam940]